ncbi:hypothetical protein Nepgr_020422 [Nepenthes gracilis]|uniref:Uncharacterized protein n=1 Tax=Nepenthes gracilis TaxID=150966 RepID=A0AAD3SXA2_NEPGR|nr:hypothetical protein Nepgr_020422 [Nepenthes gracilis]
MLLGISWIQLSTKGVWLALEGLWMSIHAAWLALEGLWMSIHAAALFAVMPSSGLMMKCNEPGVEMGSWVDVLEPLPGHSSSDQVSMPEVVQADPPLHRGPAAIGSSSRPPFVYPSRARESLLFEPSLP